MKAKSTVLCTSCGSPTLFTQSRLCQKCYAYFQSGNIVYPLPPAGEVHFTPEGLPICHICGKAYSKLGNHIAFAHHITTREYKEQFGLCYNTKLTSKPYQTLMRNYNTEQNMPIILPQLGQKTQFKPNKTGSRRSSLQESLLKKQSRCS